jgi:hypothetical protein
MVPGRSPVPEGFAVTKWHGLTTQEYRSVYQRAWEHLLAQSWSAPVYLS